VSSIKFCVCGLPTPAESDCCDNCEGKNSIHIEGDIYKKQKKGGALKKYWYVLLSKELYTYKKKGDLKHKEMKSLSGVYIKDEPDSVCEETGIMLYQFKLIFPNKRRLYYFKSLEEKHRWMDAIKQSIGYHNLYDFYDVGESLGKGKYGVVKQAFHKRTK